MCGFKRFGVRLMISEIWRINHHVGKNVCSSSRGIDGHRRGVKLHRNMEEDSLKNAIFLLLSDDVGQIASSEEPTALLRIYSSISSRLLQVKGYSLLLEYRMRRLA